MERPPAPSRPILTRMNIPVDREYTATHEWVRLDGTTAVVGVTDQDPSNATPPTGIEILPEGTPVKTGDKVATIVTGRGRREVLAPISGSLLAGNEEVLTSPSLVFSDPFGKGWLFRLRVEAGEEIEHLLEPSVYAGQLVAIDPDI
jgi:glycine cleavage system H protein